MGSSLMTWVFAACVCSMLPLMEGKMQTGTLTFSANNEDVKNWQFVSKFGFGTGTSKYKFRYRIPASMGRESMVTPLDTALILDEEWHEVSNFAGTCSERNAKARKIHKMAFGQEVNGVVNWAGDWSAWETATVAQSIRPHIWYFVASICNEDFSASPLTIDYEIQMAQEDGSEFGVEMQGMMTLNFIVLLCLVGFLIRHGRRCRAFANSAGQLHAVIWALSAAIVFQFASQSLHTLHLRIYQSNGMGSPLVDWLSDVLFMLGQVVSTTLLMAIAMGYTLLPSRNNCMDVVKLVFGLSFIIHTALVSFSKMQDNSASKNHEHEGPIGWVLLSVRVMLFAWFVFATQQSQAEGGLRLHDFLHRFRLAGSVYFLAYPILFVIVHIFAAYLRHPILQIGLIAMQTVSNVCLSELFLSRGTYFKVSALSSSFLPGSHAVGAFDKAS